MPYQSLFIGTLVILSADEGKQVSNYSYLHTSSGVLLIPALVPIE